MALPELEGTNNDGPGDPDGTRRRIRAHILIASAFGIALGFTCALFFLVFHYFGVPVPDGPLKDIFNTLIPNIFKAFLFGLISGTLIAFIYNGLVSHHFNIFNIDAEDYA